MSKVPVSTPPSRFHFALFLAFVVSAVVGCGRIALAEEHAAADRMMTDVQFLASDRLEGRDVGTPGGAEAANYIRERFRALGLVSAVPDGSYFQPFKVRVGTSVADDTYLEFVAPDGNVHRLVRGEDYQPLVVGGDGTFDAPIVFAGYGIATEEDPAYDEFAHIDVEGKVVLIMRREPQQEDPKSKFNGTGLTRHAAIDAKIKNCWQRKAAGVLLVTEPLTVRKEGKDELVPADYIPGSNAVGLPVCQITQAWANRLLESTPLGNLTSAETAIDEKLEPVSQNVPGWHAKGKFDFYRVEVETPNVIGMIEGEGPHADETILIGAHYDHIGMGGPNSRNPGIRAIHNGADDNASGTALLLELARRFAEKPEKPSRRLIFMAFSGEERGLLGSAHYVRKDPVIPLEKIVMMLNFDMVGRLRNDKLIVYGTKTAKGIEEILTKLDDDDDQLRLSQIALGVPASDHISFYRKDIPALHLFTGTHPEYHMPTDDADTLNYEGMQDIANFTEKLVDEFLALPERPEFVKVEEKDPHAGMQLSSGPNSAYLGTSPDYGDEIEGVLLNGVREGSPADMGGLKAGDIIVEFEGQKIENVRQYTSALYSHKPGDIVKITVLRGEDDKKERITLDVTLGSRGQPTDK